MAKTIEAWRFLQNRIRRTPDRPIKTGGEGEKPKRDVWTDVTPGFEVPVGDAIIDVLMTRGEKSDRF